MALASEILARFFENSTGPYPELSNKELLKKFATIDNQLHLVRMLTGLNIAEPESIGGKNVILIFHPENKLEVHRYKDASEALIELFKLEKQYPALDVVLVKADSNEDIRMAFQNYFSDAKDFIRMLTEARNGLQQIP